MVHRHRAPHNLLIIMRIKITQFRVDEGDTVDLRKWPTTVDPVYQSKKDYQQVLQEHVARLSEQQQLLYATERFAVLLIFQAMDTAGKDGAIKHVMSGVNPQGCDVVGFKQPSAEELRHNFLWRAARVLPERGRIGIFNRSYYESVLVVRVHPELLDREMPQHPRKDLNQIWRRRYQSIINFERHLHANDTRIVKIYLHLSRKEQRKRLLERIDDPAKNWKFSPADIEERQFWNAYRGAYEACLAATSTKSSPWYVVPADDKENARLIVSQILVDSLEGLGMYYPKTDAKRRRELAAFRRRLAAPRG
jgi:PPK2 family polyphosphate:nucleotide phosphotransferase